jgi:hypothetical protein
MKYTDEHLKEAIDKNIFTREQVDSFKDLAAASNDNVSRFQKVLYYGGCLLIISALTWLMESSWDTFGPIGILGISIVYFIGFSLAGYFLFFKKKLQTAGGLLFAIPIAITPLIAYAILKLLNFWPAKYDYDDYYIWINAKWVILEAAAIVVALPFLLKTKFPFLVFLIAGSLWFFSMDIVKIMYEDIDITWTRRAYVSEIFGAVMILIGYIADLKFKKDYSFWLYLFGVVTLDSGLSVFYNDNALGFITLGLINIALIAVALFLNRNVFLVFGAIGLIELLSRLSWKYFEGSPVFPFLLTGIGILLIILGIFFQKNKTKIDETIKNKLPVWLLKLKPGNTA